MTKKERIIASLIGVAIGSVLGFMMSMSMLKDAEKCRTLAEENRMLQEMIMDCQGD
jgi:mannitol-specific phosphotransferase system IIBC component